jgi:hypothetical protein
VVGVQFPLTPLGACPCAHADALRVGVKGETDPTGIHTELFYSSVR